MPLCLRGQGVDEGRGNSQSGDLLHVLRGRSPSPIINGAHRYESGGTPTKCGKGEEFSHKAGDNFPGGYVNPSPRMGVSRWLGGQRTLTYISQNNQHPKSAPSSPLAMPVGMGRFESRAKEKSAGGMDGPLQRVWLRVTTEGEGEATPRFPFATPQPPPHLVCCR